MNEIVGLVWMHKIIIKTKGKGELDLFMKSTVKTLRSNYPISGLHVLRLSNMCM